ncbi:MAG: helix-turn-helix domain-containing protein [Propionicimonas sp.]|uniref:TetR/AcrR family transcriptional regulator n=1 Tax=Propionicimonas sp. TaxID=1955623 RepID=UPI003D10FFEF
MVRWQPGATERLSVAALELFEEHGYDQTTVAEIAERAGVTERTFYRHFPDKREVLFAGSGQLADRVSAAVAAEPEGARPSLLVDAALAGLAASFPDERRSYARRRQARLDAEPALRERELLKLATLKATLVEALVARGASDPAATMTAEAALSVFHVAFLRWIGEGEQRGMAELQREALGELRAALGGANPGADAGR